jgi:hypothetical protein
MGESEMGVTLSRCRNHSRRSLRKIRLHLAPPSGRRRHSAGKRKEKDPGRWSRRSLPSGVSRMRALRVICGATAFGATQPGELRIQDGDGLGDGLGGCRRRC